MIVRSAGLCGESRLVPAVVCACVGTMLSIGAGALAQDLPSQGALAMETPASTVPPEEAATAESRAAPAEPETQKQVDDKFHVSFTPYMWLTSLSGNLGVKGASIDVDASFVDIVQDSNVVFGLMGALEFQWDRIIVQFNAAWTYTEMEQERGILRDVKLKADMTTQASWIELLGGYRILDRGLAEINDKRRFTFDAFAGARLTIIDADTDVTIGRSSESVSRDFSEEEIWAEPFIGLRTGIDLTERFELSLRGDIGGFGVAGSEFSWQFVGGIGYTFHMGSWNGAALLGFRALSQDYEDDDFEWDVTTYGPILGVRFTF